MRLNDLTVFILDQVRPCAVENARRALGYRCSMFFRIKAFTRCFNGNDLNACIVKE